jgi:hypothetical protein
MDIVAKRREAARLGCSTFVTDVPCIHGHLSPRYTSNMRCTVCETARLAEPKYRVSDEDKRAGIMKWKASKVGRESLLTSWARRNAKNQFPNASTDIIETMVVLKRLTRMIKEKENGKQNSTHQ